MSDTCRSLYVHVPLCRTRCGYCDFYSEVYQPDAVAPLVAALLTELDRHAAMRPLAFETIYVGGGTPTILPPTALADLLNAVAAHRDPHTALEFTVEANPATVTQSIADVLAAAGVTRVSIGAQSFDPDELRRLDRTHDPEDVARTVATCRAAGIGQISLDLIFGIPGQTLASLAANLDRARTLTRDHISCYGLTYEPGTPLREQYDRGLVRAVDEDLEAEMYELVLDTLPAAGLPQYEISNFARPGAACRHNLLCWQNAPYIGIGPAAAGYLDDVRYRNMADTAAYVAAIHAGQSPWQEHERLNPAQRAGEAAMLALRTTAGIDRAGFARLYGADPLEHFAETVRRHVDDGLLAVTPTSIHLTRSGLLLANRVMADFLV